MKDIREILRLPIDEARLAAKSDIDAVDSKLLEIANREEVLERDNELVEEAIGKALRYKQRAMDERRLKAKALRQADRVNTTNEKLVEALLDQVSSLDFQPVTPSIPEQAINTGIFQLTDLHINEVIHLDETGNSNEYNFAIAAARLGKYVTEAVIRFKKDNVRDVVVSLTGDLINSTGPLPDKAITNEESKATSILIAAALIYQAIYTLAQNFNITLCTVVGNESRLADYGYSKKVAIDSADYLIHYILQARLQNTIKYVPITAGSVQLLEINNSTILIAHGDKLPKDTTKAYSKLLKLYPEIDYLLVGHIHETLIGPNYARSGSLCGNNAYSQGLCLRAPASQNIHIVNQAGEITSIAINLQDITGYQALDYPRLASAVGQSKSIEKLNRVYKLNQLTN